MRISLEARVSLTLLIATLSAAGQGVALATLLDEPWVAFALTLAASVPFSIWLARRISAPLLLWIDALVHGFDSLKDGDFSISLATTRHDELGELVARYNQVSSAMRNERQQIHQRELLLESVLQSNPTATVLTVEPDVILFANVAARELLTGGKRLERLSWGDVLSHCAEPLQEALARGEDSLFHLDTAEGAEIYHCGHREFVLNGIRHNLILIRPLTRELSRQEVAVWKKLIRVVSHELNNSLAPIASLTHSAKLILGSGQSLDKLPLILDTIASRSAHLQAFIEGYVQFARLPAPQRQTVELAPFIARLGALMSFRLTGPVPTLHLCADPGQLEQVLINLLKNAREASPADADVELAIIDLGEQGVQFEVRDRGPGMDERQMQNALLPFYSTKQSGTGLGLPLCREILEGHGGSLRLANRDGGGLVASAWLPVG